MGWVGHEPGLTPYPWGMAEIRAQVNWDTYRVKAWLSGHLNQAPYALSQALNKVANEVVTGLEGESKRVFDKPTAFAQKGWYAYYSNKQNLVAEVRPKDKVLPYLYANIHGTKRGAKPYEGKFRGVATGASPAPTFFPTRFQRRDSRGNVSQAALRKIVDSQTSGKTGRNSVFIGKPANSDKPFGVYQRMGVKQRKLRPLFLPATRGLAYKSIFPIDKVGQKIVDRRLQGYFFSELQKAVESAR